MTTLDNPVTIAVEGSARIVRGVLLPYNDPALIAERDADGKLIVYREVWDRDSTVLPSTMVPLLQSHDESRPIGKITKLWHDDHGLQLEAELVGSGSEIESVREKVGHGVMAGLSVGFYSDATGDQWFPADKPDGTPIVLRRGARVREASLCVWPAFKNAKVVAIRNRTEQQRWSDEILAEHRAKKERERAELDQFIATQRAERQRRHDESERIKAESAQLLRESRALSAAIAKRSPQTRSYW